jgi:hypothetical protein
LARPRPENKPPATQAPDERGWRATFYTTGMEHSPTSATGTGYERTLWHATQLAAWEALVANSEAIAMRMSTPDLGSC